MFSARTHVPDCLNWYAPRIERARGECSRFLDLTESNPTQVQLQYDEPGLRRALSEARWLEYHPDSRGQRDARVTLAGHFARAGTHRKGPAPDADQLVLTASTSEAYALLFKTLCDPGQSVLVPEPSYPLFAELARYESVELLPYRLLYDGAWTVDFDSLRRARRADTRAILVVSPNNPTGNCLKEYEFHELQRLDLPLIVDEVFADFVAPKVSGVHAAWTQTSSGLVFVLDGLSKWGGLPQCKLAWTLVCGDRALCTEALRRLEYVADAYLSPNGISQNAIAGLLTAAGTSNRAIKQRIATNLAVLDERVRGSAVTRLHHEGGWNVVLHLPSFIDEQAWLERFFTRGVGVQPGWFYDFPFGPVVVISLLPECAVFVESVDLLLDEVSNACQA